MKIHSIEIKNFRSIKDETIDCLGFNSFVGPNGSGKSTVLNALNVFFDVKLPPGKWELKTNKPVRRIKLRKKRVGHSRRRIDVSGSPDLWPGIEPVYVVPDNGELFVNL